MESFNRLVKLAARAFYDDVTTKGDNQPKTGRSDNRGMAVVVLDALTRRQWVREEDLAKDLKLHSKQLRRTLRYFEEEKLVTRDHRKETAKGARIFSAAVAATGDGQSSGKDGEEKLKLHTHSYCCLDYAQANEIFDVVRYRLHRMRKKLKDELENRNTVQEYVCPNCNRRYTAFDALQLISPDDESFRCESCRAELVAESDKRAAEEMGDNDDNARRRRREKLKDMLQKMEEQRDEMGCREWKVEEEEKEMDLKSDLSWGRMQVQLKPLTDLLNRVKDLPVPEFGSLQAWEARANAAGRATNGDPSANDSSRSSQGQGYGGTPMPFLGETKVEVALSGVPVKDEDSKPDVSATTMKVLPPWMIKQGMNLTMEQRGEVKQELKTESGSTANQHDDKKSKVNDKDDGKSIQASQKKHLCDEYLKAYYAALLQRQQDQEEAAKRNQQESANTDNMSSEMPRQVGMKSKREDDDRDDGVEWEEAPTGNADKTYKMHDLNIEAEPEASGEDEDDIDWEEGGAIEVSSIYSYDLYFKDMARSKTGVSRQEVYGKSSRTEKATGTSDTRGGRKLQIVLYRKQKQKATEKKVARARSLRGDGVQDEASQVH
ncbi:hypothetical protein Scep_022435 [Stephania cephalantha]|uniref:HTH TFE/IIEalpha-type domain-containing protein n=1 Tax=Stephania cephalantha TaxID=152367 RepID=A0AAP0F5E1_9MAGN